VSKKLALALGGNLHLFRDTQRGVTVFRLLLPLYPQSVRRAVFPSLSGDATGATTTGATAVVLTARSGRSPATRVDGAAASDGGNAAPVGGVGVSAASAFSSNTAAGRLMGVGPSERADSSGDVAQALAAVGVDVCGRETLDLTLLTAAANAPLTEAGGTVNPLVLSPRGTPYMQAVASSTPADAWSLSPPATAPPPAGAAPGSGAASSTLPPVMRATTRHASTVTPRALTGRSSPSRCASVMAGSYVAGGDDGGSSSAAGDEPLRLHVLYADDERVNGTVMARMLARLGCTSEVVEDGADVVPALVASGQLPAGATLAAAGAGAASAGAGAAAPHRRPYDVVVLDVMMRDVCGDTVCRALRRVHGLQLPVVAATGNAHDVAALLSLGFDAVLEKPFTREMLRGALARWARRGGGGGGGGGGAS